MEYIVKVAERGSYLGLDRFSIDTIQPLKVRAQVLKELCDRGYRDQIIVSHDCMCFMDGRDSLNIFGGTGMTFIKRTMRTWNINIPMYLIISGRNLRGSG